MVLPLPGSVTLAKDYRHEEIETDDTAEYVVPITSEQTVPRQDAVWVKAR